MPSPPPLQLLITTNHDADGVPHVYVAGEVDMAVAGQVGAAVRDHRGDAEHVVLDLSDVSFMDSTGVGLTVRLQEEGRREGWTLALVASPQVERVIDLCGLRALLDLRPAAQPT